jgi:hypothetical protein
MRGVAALLGLSALSLGGFGFAERATPIVRYPRPRRCDPIIGEIMLGYAEPALLGPESPKPLSKRARRRARGRAKAARRAQA